MATLFEGVCRVSEREGEGEAFVEVCAAVHEFCKGSQESWAVERCYPRLVTALLQQGMHEEDAVCATSLRGMCWVIAWVLWDSVDFV